jgi:hypothetical protein
MVCVQFSITHRSSSNEKLGTAYVYGHPITPCAVADAKGNCTVVMVCISLLLGTAITDDPSPQILIPGSKNSYAQHVSS